MKRIVSTRNSFTSTRSATEGGWPGTMVAAEWPRNTCFECGALPTHPVLGGPRTFIPDAPMRCPHARAWTAARAESPAFRLRVLELPSRFHTSRQMKNSLVNRSAPRSAWPRGSRLEGAREVAYEVRF